MADYSGVPLSSLHWGTNQVTTGMAGPSNASDYIANGISVSLDNVNPLPAGAVIPPGATVYLYVPPGTPGVASGTGGTSLVGTQIPIDTANILNTNANTQATLAGIPIAQQNANTNSQNAATSLYSAQVQAAQVQAQVDQARNQYYLDVAKFGQEQADTNFNQRLQAIAVQFQNFNAGMQGADFDLGQNQFNFNQRDTEAAKKLQIMGMLADRSGPQDWVKYSNLLDNLAGPEAMSSATFDPFSILDGLNDPSNVQRPQAPNASITPNTPVPFNGTYQTGTPLAPPAPVAMPSAPPPAAAPAPSPTPAPAFGSTAPANPYPQTPGAAVPLPPGTNTVPSGMGAYSGVPNEQVANLRPGEWSFVTTGEAGPSNVDDYSGFRVAGQDRNALAPGSAIAPGTSIWLQRLAAGGLMGGRMALVGDSVSGRPTGHEELVVNLNPDPRDRIAVIPMSKLMAGADEGVPRAATGGTYGMETGNSITYNRYSPEALGSQGFIRRNAEGGRGREFGSFGASLGNPRFGLKDVPTAINLQTFGNMLPSQQLMTKGMYQDALGVNFDDLLEQARRAAPFGQTNPVTRYAA